MQKKDTNFCVFDATTTSSKAILDTSFKNYPFRVGGDNVAPTQSLSCLLTIAMLSRLHQFFVRQLSLTSLVVRSIFHLVGGSGALAFTHLVSSGCGADFPLAWLKVQLQRIWSSWLCVLFSTGYLTVQDSCQLLSSIFFLSTQIENKFH